METKSFIKKKFDRNEEKYLFNPNRNSFPNNCSVVTLFCKINLWHWRYIYFDEYEGSIQNYARKRSVFNSDINPLFNISPEIDIRDLIPYLIHGIPTPEIYGMSIHLAFNICLTYEENEVNQTIATIGVPDEIKEKMINESQYFYNISGIMLSEISFMDFNNEEEMEKYIKSKKYGQSEETPPICFGISFSEDRDNHKYDYKLHYFENDNNGDQNVPNSPYLKDPFQTVPDFGSYNKYQYNGYTYIMKIITDYIYNQEIDNETKIKFRNSPNEI